MCDGVKNGTVYREARIKKLIVVVPLTIKSPHNLAFRVSSTAPMMRYVLSDGRMLR